MRAKWQQMWNNEPDTNKLKFIKPNVNFWGSSIQNKRQEEVILTRLRIGHTRLTHGHLMSTPHEDVPRCVSCNTVLTVKHILSDCRLFSLARNLYFKNRTLKDILEDSNKFSLYRILAFLRKTNLICKI